MLIRLVASRIVISLFSLLVVSWAIFWAVEWLPGDTAARVLGREASAESVRVLRARLHLADPPLVRYGHWLEHFVQGDWGESLAADRPVVRYVFPRLRNTLILAGLALGLYLILSLTIGVVTALFHGQVLDTWLSVLTLVGMSMPEFVVGILLVLVFAVAVPLFPPLALMDQVKTFPGLLYTLSLPILTLTAAMTAYAVRMMRDNLIEVLESDYVQMATLKGLPRVRVVLRHALPNALGPALNVTALNIAWLMGGVVVVETVFNFPGLGRLLVDSISFHDVPVIEAIAVVLASVYMLANLVADVLVLVLNPRLRAS
ncbi:MAG: ABC transporter permease [Bacillati bacterium ANGP1]|uniref:ABC transporter permease n=1 Tax=Candidatus Segetimicrobium genomatis TaxID=2569760 RepID=A0A537J7X9_9BACT|nr:MAG: ABC transporter permease [Terrabacteria group bacterium ANGP1]